MNFDQLEVRFYTYEITFHISLAYDLSLYKPTELESSFIEIANPKRSNIIIGCICRHPNMDLDEFNYNYLNTLFDKVSKENTFYGLTFFTYLSTTYCPTN